MKVLIKILMVTSVLANRTAFANEDWSGGPGGFGDDNRGLAAEHGFDKHGGGRHGGRHHGPGGPGGPGGKEAVEACASSLGITLPEKGSETKLSEENRKSLRECVHGKMEEKRAELDACLKAAGVEFGEDGKPKSRPTKEQMESCRNGSSGSSSSGANSTSAI